MKHLIIKGNEVLYKYSDKNGIKIYIEKEYSEVLPDLGNSMYIYIHTKREITVAVIDYCFTECVYLVNDLFRFLNKKTKSKVAKRWLWRKIRDIEFGNTGYKIKDLYDISSKKINYNDLEDKYNRYWNNKKYENKKIINN